MNREPFVWVIEMKEGSRWSPCAAAFLLRKDAKGYAMQWQESNPRHEFRVKKYTRGQP